MTGALASSGCAYYDAGRCSSCSIIAQPYDIQLAAKQAAAEAALPDAAWLPPVASAPFGFRNKAKMVVAGSVDAPTLGILGPGLTGIDLEACPLHEQPIQDALPHLAAFVTLARLTPYDVRAGRGELKHIIVTASPDARLMVRFVVRSTEPVPRIRKHLEALRRAVPSLDVVTVNVQPIHAAVLEGDDETVLTERAALPMRVAGHELLIGPRSFFQTNTAVADALYREARAWVDDAGARSLWDLYCGVGGFALALARRGRAVTGVEASTDAVAAAREAARRAGVDATFVAGDAVAWGTAQSAAPDLVVVNPPRRGIGDLAGWLDASGAPRVLYSSCNPASLARDVAAMPSMRVVRARLFDMFPNTEHAEVLALLER